MWIRNNNKKACNHLRFFTFILLLIPISILTQDNFITIDDYNGQSQIYLDHLSFEGNLYVLGGTVCNTGECGVLSKYNNEGELIFLNVLNNIDVNSSRCLGQREDALVLVALSKYETGARVQIYDLQGNLILDNLINRDSALVYTWPVDALYLEEHFYLVANENYENEPRQTAVYKVDYEGNVLDYVRLPYEYRGEIYTLTQLENGNLFVSRPYLDDELCAFEHGTPDRPNAVMFYEISADSLNIVREKQNICHQSTNSVSHDCTVLSNNIIVRNVLWINPINDKIIHAANIYYNSEWEEIGIDKYPQLIVGNPLAHYGTLNSRTFSSLDNNYFFVLALISYPYPEEDFPYVDFLIQKWDIDRNLIWEREFSDPNIHNRLYLTSLFETDSAITLSGYVWSDIDDGGTQDFAVMTLDLNGCFNGDCSDKIYLNGPPTAVHYINGSTEISIFPNPALDKINVKTNSLLRGISLYDLDGALIREEAVSGFVHTMNLVTMASGMYILRVESDDGIWVEKVIKL